MNKVFARNIVLFIAYPSIAVDGILAHNFSLDISRKQQRDAICLVVCLVKHHIIKRFFTLK